MSASAQQLKLLKVGSRRGELEGEMEETGKRENSLQAAWCVCMCVCVCILQREFCVVSGWVRESVGLGSLQCTQPLCSPLG